MVVCLDLCCVRSSRSREAAITYRGKLCHSARYSLPGAGIITARRTDDGSCALTIAVFVIPPGVGRVWHASVPPRKLRAQHTACSNDNRRWPGQRPAVDGRNETVSLPDFEVSTLSEQATMKIELPPGCAIGTSAVRGGREHPCKTTAAV